MFDFVIVQLDELRESSVACRRPGKPGVSVQLDVGESQAFCADRFDEKRSK